MRVKIRFTTQTPDAYILDVKEQAQEMTPGKFIVMLPHIRANGMLKNGKRFILDQIKTGWDEKTSEPQSEIYLIRELEAAQFEAEKGTQKKPGESI